jgi:hypothetical protein
MSKDETLKLVLEAITTYLSESPDPSEKAVEGLCDAASAARKALAAPVPEPDWKAEYLKSVESGCITLDELREALAELEATNRQVEILSDALAESRREVAKLKELNT